jgi:hypothetical protein
MSTERTSNGISNRTARIVGYIRHPSAKTNKGEIAAINPTHGAQNRYLPIQS